MGRHQSGVLARSLPHCQSPLFGAPTPSRGRGPGDPTPASRDAFLLPLPAKLSSPNCAPGPAAGAPPPRAEQGQACAQGVAGPGAASARGQPPALGGARRAGYKASARWSLRLLLAQSISARRSRAPVGPAPPGAAGHTSPRPPAPGASPGANFAGRRAEVGAGGRSCPAAPRPHHPPARSPSTAASSGNSSSAAPSLRRAMAALPGASGRGAAGPGRPGLERAPRARGAGGSGEARRTDSRRHRAASRMSHPARAERGPGLRQRWARPT